MKVILIGLLMLGSFSAFATAYDCSAKDAANGLAVEDLKLKIGPGGGDLVGYHAGSYSPLIDVEGEETNKYVQVRASKTERYYRTSFGKDYPGLYAIEVDFKTDIGWGMSKYDKMYGRIMGLVSYDQDIIFLTSSTTIGSEMYFGYSATNSLIFKCEKRKAD